ncbi:MAG: hypothetical protein M0P23_05315 [Bacteroidales bacterium]|nr:hypothetical protein [Bacteroidales bacterium]
MDIAAHKGTEVTYNDSYIPTASTLEGRKYNSVELTADELTVADCVMFTTNHRDCDLEFIQQHAHMIMDMRNIIEEETKIVYKL